MARRAAIIALALLAAGLAACDQTEATPEESAAILENLTRTVPPENYRAEVVVLERLLFAAGELTDPERQEIALALDDLADKLVKRREAPMAGVVAGEIRMVRMGLGPGGRWSRVTGRLHWLRIRNHLFGDAPWFRYQEERPATSA
jgi:Flp pilus assembly protein CpaB